MNFLLLKDGKRITDSNIAIANRKRRYNIECQSSVDGTIIIRVFEYASQIAVTTAITENPYETRFVLPNSGIIYLRCNNEIPAKHTIILDTPEGEMRYSVPILKIKDYSLEQLLEKRLWILIPFYFFNYKIDEMEKDFTLIKRMQDTYLELWKTLDSYIVEGKINEYEKATIKAMCDKVAISLSDKYQNVKKGVDAVMGGQVLEYEAKTILNKGKAEGKAEEAIIAVFNLLNLGISEDTARELYPEHFEEGKAKYLETKK